MVFMGSHEVCIVYDVSDHCNIGNWVCWNKVFFITAFWVGVGAGSVHNYNYVTILNTQVNY